jgi:membrane protease YdiL (CAAX protease family)
MENQYLASRHPFMQLMLLMIITIVSTLFITMLSMIAGLIIFGIQVTDFMQMLSVSDPANVPVLKFLQISQSLAMFVIPPIVFGWFYLRNPWLYLNIDKGPERKKVATVLALAIVILPVLNLLSVVNQEMRLPGFLSGIEEWMKRSEEQVGALTEAFLTVNTFPGYLVNVLMVVLIPAFGEEFFFRGALQKIFLRWFRNPHFAILLVAVLFSATHMQFYGFFPRFVLGVIFGYLFYWSGNIWYPVLAHGINNFLPVTLTYFLRDRFDPAELDAVGTGPDAWIWAIPALMLSAWAILYFYRSTRDGQAANNK